MDRDILIIGGGTAGLTAAIYALRGGKSATILEATSVGGQIANSPLVENYPGLPSISGMEYSDRLFEQAMALGAELELETVESITPGTPITVNTDCDSHSCDALIIATGVCHRHLGIPAEENYMGRGVSYCAVCDGAFYRGQAVCVVGGGNTAVQSAISLSQICEKVYLIHRRTEFRAEPVLVSRMNAIPNIELCLNETIANLSGDEDLNQVVLSSGRILDATGLFVCIGQIPNNEFLRDVVDLDENGFILADESCVTSQPNIFVAGDCRTKEIRQLTTAAADGAVSALAALASHTY